MEKVYRRMFNGNSFVPDNFNGVHIVKFSYCVRFYITCQSVAVASLQCVNALN